MTTITTPAAIGESWTRIRRVLPLVILIAACAPENPPQPDASVTAEAAVESELAGTAWQLVRIMSMDDSVYEPQDPTRYTLEFGDDGSARIRADCNRGTGTWTSERTGGLEFGVIASTNAMCGPDSLHDRYMAQFEWVRSYVIEDGHLFLATMADGAIIEFAPD